MMLCWTPQQLQQMPVLLLPWLQLQPAAGLAVISVAEMKFPCQLLPHQGQSQEQLRRRGLLAAEHDGSSRWWQGSSMQSWGTWQTWLLLVHHQMMAAMHQSLSKNGKMSPPAAAVDDDAHSTASELMQVRCHSPNATECLFHSDTSLQPHLPAAFYGFSKAIVYISCRYELLSLASGCQQRYWSLDDSRHEVNEITHLPGDKGPLSVGNMNMF
jgi:hypothetical protein